jgi:circadian clock protein KaiC
VTQAANNLEKFSFYDEAAFNDGIHFTDMRSMMDLIGTGKKNVESDNLTEADLEEILSAIEEIVIETDADRVVLDSITALAYMFDEKRLVRYFIFRLGALLDSLDCTTFLTSEVSGDGYSVYNVEEFIADGIIQMTQRDVQNDLQRMLQIIKLRGRDYVSESVPFTITAEGINLFYMEESLTYDSPSTQISTGVPGIDAMCEGGVFMSSVSMVHGPSGSGKTLLSLHFIEQGLKNDENVLYIGFEESRSQLLRNATNFGMDLTPHIDSEALTVLSDYAEQRFPADHLRQIKTYVDKHNVDRIAIDPISAIDDLFPADQYAKFARQAVNYLKQQQVSTMVTTSSPHLMGTTELSDSNLSKLADNIFLLKYAETAGKLSRVISVLKMRGTDHDNRLRRYRITGDGMDIGSPVSAFEGVLSGTTRKTGESTGNRLKQLFLSKLGPMGEQEFQQLRERGMNAEAINGYVNRLVKDSVISQEEGEQFRQKAFDILDIDPDTVDATGADDGDMDGLRERLLPDR